MRLYVHIRIYINVYIHMESDLFHIMLYFSSSQSPAKGVCHYVLFYVSIIYILFVYMFCLANWTLCRQNALKPAVALANLLC